jgi:hypothetical protein
LQAEARLRTFSTTTMNNTVKRGLRVGVAFVIAFVSISLIMVGALLAITN